MVEIDLEKDNSPLVPSESSFNREYSKHPSKDTRHCLKTLRCTPSRSDNCQAHSGWILKKNSSSSSFRRVYAYTEPSECALYYSSSEKGKGTKIRIGYATVEEMGVLDPFAQAQLEESGDYCKYRLRIWTSKKQHIFTASDDETFSAWKVAIDNLLLASYTDGDLHDRQQAVAKLRPLVEDQETEVLKRYVYLRTVLDETGMLPASAANKWRQGTVHILLKDENTWERVNLVLHEQFLNVYSVDDKRLPMTIVALKYLISVEMDSSSQFTIVTPLQSVSIRAKHEVSAREWIGAIEQAAVKKNPNLTTDGQNVHSHGKEEETGLASFQGTPVLSYQMNGFFGAKKKRFEIKGKVVTIGRSGSNLLCVDDSKVSRNHAKIEMKNGSPILTDLGSSYGTKVNDSDITSKPLQLGDRIELGNIVFTVEAK